MDFTVPYLHLQSPLQPQQIWFFSPFQTPIRHDPVHNGGGGVGLGRGKHVEDALWQVSFADECPELRLGAESDVFVPTQTRLAMLRTVFRTRRRTEGLGIVQGESLTQ